MLPNYEAVPETKGGVQDRSSPSEDKKTWKKVGGVVVRSKSLPNFFLAYANGKIDRASRSK